MSEYLTKVPLDEGQVKVIKAIVEEYLIPATRVAATREIKEFLKGYEKDMNSIEILKEQVKYLNDKIGKIIAGQEALGILLMDGVKKNEQGSD